LGLITRLSDSRACTPCTLLLLAFLRDMTPVDDMELGPAQSSQLGALLPLLETNDMDAREKEKVVVARVDELVRNGGIRDRILRRESGHWPRTRAAAEHAPGTLTERYLCRVLN
jgi:hypothetical protein